MECTSKHAEGRSTMFWSNEEENEMLDVDLPRREEEDQGQGG